MSVSVNALRCFLFLAFASMMTVPALAQKDHVKTPDDVDVSTVKHAKDVRSNELEADLRREIIEQTRQVQMLIGELFDEESKLKKVGAGATLERPGSVRKKLELILRSKRMKEMLKDTKVSISTQGKVTVIGPNGDITTHNVPWDELEKRLRWDELDEHLRIDLLFNEVLDAVGSEGNGNERIIESVVEAFEACMPNAATVNHTTGENENKESKANQAIDWSKELEKLESMVLEKLESINGRLDKKVLDAVGSEGNGNERIIESMVEAFEACMRNAASTGENERMIESMVEALKGCMPNATPVNHTTGENEDKESKANQESDFSKLFEKLDEKLESINGRLDKIDANVKQLQKSM